MSDQVPKAGLAVLETRVRWQDFLDDQPLVRQAAVLRRFYRFLARSKLWHNLRCSCQTELQESFPADVVCAWIGNSEQVAKDHYLQVTDAHFERATRKAVQNAVHPMPETGGTSQNEKTPDLPGYSGVCLEMAEVVVGAEGLEAVDVSALQGNALQNLPVLPGHQDGPFPADLMEVVRAWDSLPVEVRAAMLAIVRGAGG